MEMENEIKIDNSERCLSLLKDITGSLNRCWKYKNTDGYAIILSVCKNEDNEICVEYIYVSEYEGHELSIMILRNNDDFLLYYESCEMEEIRTAFKKWNKKVSKILACV